MLLLLTDHCPKVIPLPKHSFRYRGPTCTKQFFNWGIVYGAGISFRSIMCEIIFTEHTCVLYPRPESVGCRVFVITEESLAERDFLRQCQKLQEFLHPTILLHLNSQRLNSEHHAARLI